MDKQNEKIKELTGKQMEKVSGGDSTSVSGDNTIYGPAIDTLPKGHGTDCFICPGVLINNTAKKCGRSLQLTSGGAYRCNNSLCSLFVNSLNHGF